MNHFSGFKRSFCHLLCCLSTIDLSFPHTQDPKPETQEPKHGRSCTSIRTELMRVRKGLSSSCGCCCLIGWSSHPPCADCLAVQLIPVSANASQVPLLNYPTRRFEWATRDSGIYIKLPCLEIQSTTGIIAKSNTRRASEAARG